jgi:hypothetical protein
MRRPSKSSTIHLPPNVAREAQRRLKGPEDLATLRPFKPADGRINRRGRPRNFDAFRELCQKICHERVVTLNGEVMTRLEVILRDWAGSKDVQKQIALVQYGYGKPVDRIETNALEPKTTLRLYYAHERPDLLEPHEREKVEQQLESIRLKRLQNTERAALQGPESAPGISENS